MVKIIFRILEILKIQTLKNLRLKMLNNIDYKYIIIMNYELI